MEIETILNAMEKVRVGSGWDMDRRIRQYNAFRTRILRMDAEMRFNVAFERNAVQVLSDRIAELETVQNCTGYNNQGSRRVAELEQQLAEKDKAIEVRNVRIFNRDVQLFGKDARIAELEDVLDWNINIVEQMTKKKEGNNEQD